MKWVLVEPWVELWMGSMLRVSLYGGLAIAGAWAVCRLVPRICPALRNWLWRLVYVKLALLILWPCAIRIPLFPRPSVRIEPAAALADTDLRRQQASADSMNGTQSGRHLLSGAVQVVLASSGLAMFAVWLGGVLFISIRTARNTLAVRKLLNQSQPVANPIIRQECRSLCDRLGIKLICELRTHPGVSSPLAVGLLRPVVLFPVWFPSEYSAQEIRQVLAHELAHLQRHDLLWACARRLLNMLLFFHPLVWHAEAQAALAGEIACDDAALRGSGAPIPEYASTLLRIVERGLRTSTETIALPGLGMSQSYRALAGRFRALEHARTLRFRGRKRWATLITGATALVLLIPGIFTLFHSSRIQQLDPRYPVLGFKVSHGRSHSLSGTHEAYRVAGLRFSRFVEDPVAAQPAGFAGSDRSHHSSWNARAGSAAGSGTFPRVANWLQAIGIKPQVEGRSSQTTIRTSGECCALMVRFASVSGQGQGPDIDAFLEDENGESIPLIPDRGGAGGSVRCWVIDPAPIMRAKFSLRLKLAGAGTDVAVLRLGEL